MELLGFGRLKLGSAVAPKLIDFMDNLPKARSGKIMRRLLRRDLGLPEGDTSTLETHEGEQPADEAKNRGRLRARPHDTAGETMPAVRRNQ